MSKSKYDIDSKIAVLENGIDKQVKNITKDIYKSCVDVFVLESGVVCREFNSHQYKSKMLDFKNSVLLDSTLDCALRLCISQKNKIDKVREKITNIVLTGNAIFLTLTFNDDTLIHTSVETRRRYVARFLKNNSCSYVANIDFGSKNGREHYHAIVDNAVCLKDWYSLGSINCERIRAQNESLNKVSKYITKLTNHAIKNKGIQPRLIYSRNCL